MKEQVISHEELKRRNRRGFLAAAAAGLAGFFGLRAIMTAEGSDGAPWPLRRAFELNEKISRSLYNPERENHAVNPPAPGTPPRINGNIGLHPLEEEWALSFEGAGVERKLKLEDLRAMPITQTSAEFRCIEGWSRAITYEGVRFSDFLARVAPEGIKAPYAGLLTPDEEYYVGLDMESLLHPQTILAFAMNGMPLRPENGAPLRLIIPVKYGIKSLKCVGQIYLADSPPPDYWAERGYDWYSGH